MSKKFKTFFTVSVLLNLLLLGVVFGHAGKGMFGCKASSHHLNLHDLLMTLPEPTQQLLAQPVAQFEHDSRQLHDQLSQEYIKAAHIMEQEPFDKEAYQIQVDVIQKLRTQITQGTADTLVQIATQCSPEERKKVAEKLIDRQKQFSKE